MAVGDNTLRPFTLPVLGASAASLGGIVRSNDNILRQAHNAHAIDTVAHVQSGLLAARPAAPDIGTTYLSTDIGSEGVYLYTAAGWVTVAGGGGPPSGDVFGPASSTDNAVARFDATTGKLLQDSVVLIGDTGNITGVAGLAASGAVTISGSGSLNVNTTVATLGLQFQDTGVNRMIVRLDSSTLWTMNPRTGAGAAIDSPFSLTLAANGTLALGGGGRQISINASGSAFSTVAGLYVRGSYNPSSAVARGMRLDSTQIATANSDTLYGADFAPAFTPGAFTGLTVAAVRIADNATVMTGTKYGLLIGAQSGATVANHSLGVLGTSTFGNTLTVTSGGVVVTGNSTITGTLGGLTGLTVVSGGATITGNSTVTGALDVTGTTALATAASGAFAVANARIGKLASGPEVTELQLLGGNVAGLTVQYIIMTDGTGFNAVQISRYQGDLRFSVGGTFALTIAETAVTGLATWTRKNIFPASTTSLASVRLPHGSAPTTPVDGDLWSTTAGFYGRVNGATIGPFGSGGGGSGASVDEVLAMEAML